MDILPIYLAKNSFNVGNQLKITYLKLVSKCQLYENHQFSLLIFHIEWMYGRRFWQNKLTKFASICIHHFLSALWNLVQMLLIHLQKYLLSNLWSINNNQMWNIFFKLRTMLEKWPVMKIMFCRRNRLRRHCNNWLIQPAVWSNSTDRELDVF